MTNSYLFSLVCSTGNKFLALELVYSINVCHLASSTSYEAQEILIIGGTVERLGDKLFHLGQ